MDLSFFPLTLEALDQAAGESLCLFVASDERPLTGLAGLADWRLLGRLSRLLRGGLLTGAAGEAVLTPPGGRLAFRKLFLFGIGPSAQGNDELQRHVAGGLRKLAQAGVQEAALQLPSRLPAGAGLRTLLDDLQGPARALIFSAEPQKLVAALSQAAGRSQANLERRVVKVQAPPPPVTPPRAPAPSVKARPTPPSVQPLAIPKASPLPFAPQRDAPATQVIAPPAKEIPKASPLPFAPAQPLPAAPGTEPPIAPAVTTEPPAPAPRTPTPPPAEERKPAPPPPQRYVPTEPKQNVFDSKKRKK